MIVVGGAGIPLPPGWGLSVELGGTATSGGGTQVGVGTRLGTPDHRPAPSARAGNLIARTAGEPTRTLVCTLTVDERAHGIGECSGNDGTRYALQF